MFLGVSVDTSFGSGVCKEVYTQLSRISRSPVYGESTVSSKLCGLVSF